MTNPILDSSHNESGALLNVVLLHGWGLNRGVWQTFLDQYANSFKGLKFHCLDIPGYGNQATVNSSSDLDELADACLKQAPAKAVWVGWSLGGMIALRAALKDLVNKEKRILALQLINSTPKFVQSDDWVCGVPLSIFQSFCDELAADYEKALQSFLLLQAGANKGSRDLAKQAASSISEYDNPQPQTLQLGIDCLAGNDLRDQLMPLAIPSQIVCGSLDRVTNPAASEYLAKQLKARLITLKTGHAPFISQPQEYANALQALIDDIHGLQQDEVGGTCNAVS